MSKRDPQDISPDVDMRATPPFYRRMGFYIPLILIGGLALAVMLYSQALFQLGWENRTGDAKTTVGKAFTAPGAAEVVLYRSPTTAQYLDSSGGNYENILNQWRNLLRNTERPFREVGEIAQLDSIGDAVLILPTAVALSGQEQRAIANHQRRGGAIFASGPLGARDESGRWQDWQLMRERFGVHVTEEVAANSEERFLVTFGDGPITHSLLAGTRIWLGGHGETVLRFAGGLSAGNVTNWLRTSSSKDPSMVFGDKEGTRWVLYGFTENSWNANPTHITAMVTDALDWLQRRQVAYVAAWPRTYRAAQLVEMDTEDKFENAINLAAMLEALDMRGTFYVVTSLAVKSVDTFNALAAKHEIGFHGDVHIGFKGQSEAQQRARIEAMRSQLTTIYPNPEAATGFRAPTESYDATTEILLRSAGVRHHIADPNRTDHRMPIMEVDKDNATMPPLVVLPRTHRDDLNFVANTGVCTVDIATELAKDLETTIAQGALGVLSVHSQNFAKDHAMRNAVSSLLLDLVVHRNEVWVATGGEIAQWWRQRADLSAQLTTYGSRQEMRLSYYGSAPIKNASIIVQHPRKSTLVLKPTMAWLPIGKVYPLDPYRSAIVFDEVKKGNFAYTLSFQQ